MLTSVKRRIRAAVLAVLLAGTLAIGAGPAAGQADRQAQIDAIKTEMQRVQAHLSNELRRIHIYLAYFDQANRLAVSSGQMSAQEADGRLQRMGDQLYQQSFSDAELSQLIATHRSAFAILVQLVRDRVAATQQWPNGGAASAWQPYARAELDRVQADYDDRTARRLDALPDLEGVFNVLAWTQGLAVLPAANDPFAGQQQRLIAAIPNQYAQQIADQASPPPVPLGAPAAPPTATATASPPAATASVPQAVPAAPSAGYTELRHVAETESRDASGKITREAATIHVIACHGAGEGRQIYVYQYVKRRGFRAIEPPKWSNALGGRDFASFAEAAAAGCAGVAASTSASRAGAATPPAATPQAAAPAAPVLGAVPPPSTPPAPSRLTDAAQVVQKAGFLGNWAMDCGRPASADDTLAATFVTAAGVVTLTTSDAPNRIDYSYAFKSAERLPDGKLSALLEDGRTHKVEAWVFELGYLPGAASSPTSFRVWYRRNASGMVLVKDGMSAVINNRSMPAFHLCDANVAPPNASTAAASVPRRGTHVTVTDATFESTVLRAPQPVVVTFCARWAKQCQTINPQLDAVAGDLGGKVTMALLDIQDSPKAPSTYGVQNVPTFILFSAGKAIRSRVGVTNNQQLEQWASQ